MAGWRQAHRAFSSLPSGQAAEEAAHAKTAKLWKVISLGVGIPAVLYLAKKNLIDAHHEEPKDAPPYAHLHIRRKKFPWGDGNTTLFANRHQEEHKDDASASAPAHSENPITALIRSFMDTPEKQAAVVEGHIARCKANADKQLDRAQHPISHRHFYTEQFKPARLYEGFGRS